MTPDQMDKAYSMTLLFPDRDSLPIVALDDTAGLKIGVASRAGVKQLGDEWNQPGVYLLLDRTDPDGSWGVYVGKASQGVKSRLKSHLANKDHWYRAVLILRDWTQPFNSAQVGWLEGRLYDELYSANDAQLHNGNRPSDETLPSWERNKLESVVSPVQRVLLLLGHDPAPADEQGEMDESDGSGPVRTSTRFKGITLADILEAGLVEVGTPLVSTNGVWPATASVGPGGVVIYNEQNFESPSGAAKAVTGGAANGWAFWAVDDGKKLLSLGVLRARYMESQAPAASGSS